MRWRERGKQANRQAHRHTTQQLQAVTGTYRKLCPLCSKEKQNESAEWKHKKLLVSIFIFILLSLTNCRFCCSMFSFHRMHFVWCAQIIRWPIAATLFSHSRSFSLFSFCSQRRRRSWWLLLMHAVTFDSSFHAHFSVVCSDALSLSPCLSLYFPCVFFTFSNFI